ncbi:carboxypeptidase-like regulatory domain-containing protein [Nannocystis pusilla]|uniref:carboxypeptidase-like regulatory domain-containing protein n=1 Tax=Nannocystis pusilla TaxID=889268 RepID=UPI003B7BACD1
MNPTSPPGLRRATLGHEGKPLELNGISDGEYDVQIDCLGNEDYLPRTEKLSVSDDLEVRYQLSLGGVIRGFVEDESGKRLPRAHVSAVEADAATRTDDSGMFMLSGLPSQL